MDHQYQQEQASSGANTNMKPTEDEMMGGLEDQTNTTPTGGYGNGYPQNARRQSLQENYPPPTAPFSPTQDPYGNFTHQPQQAQPYSRPSSGLSGSGDRYGYSQTYQEQNQRGRDAVRPQEGVVIKVGMVGDAQIGKTSLMVKYVEGSWDEDYIQTLGMYA